MTLSTVGSGLTKINADKEKLGLHYVGLMLVLAWYYCLWFVPGVIRWSGLLEFANILSWLANLGASGFFLLILPLFMKKGRLFENQAQSNYVLSIGLCICTLIFTMVTPVWQHFSLYGVLFPLILGFLNASLWLLWGELHGRRHSKFTIEKIAPVFAVVMGVFLLVSYVLPAPFDSIFVSCIPLLAMAAFKKETESLPEKATIPPLLPEKPRKNAMFSMAIICITISGCCAACYYNIAIIPIEFLPEEGKGYVWGVFASAVLLLMIGLAYKRMVNNSSIYQLIPWLMAACVISISLYATQDTFLYCASFEISVALCGVFEILIIMYFGSLSSKGYLAPSFAFGLSSGCVRIGFLVGNSIAVLEETLGVVDTFGQPLALGFICMLALIIIPHIRQEQNITGLTVNNNSTYEIDDICDSVIKEFGLSTREGEIIRLIAKGYTVDSISKKLYISPYTTQTHVRHIYAKMQIHKRSELLDYINMHRSE
ncbi:MAG: helix-turn-helix transcriptional regulator [Eggerthellales bacterium]|nr:helix-turn-helix transcriptional regulator [Eggerthellales bacterium]